MNLTLSLWILEISRGKSVYSEEYYILSIKILVWGGTREAKAKLMQEKNEIETSFDLVRHKFGMSVVFSNHSRLIS